MHLSNDAILVGVHCRLNGKRRFLPDEGGFCFDRRDICGPTGALADGKNSYGESVGGSISVNIVPDVIDRRPDVEWS